MVKDSYSSFILLTTNVVKSGGTIWVLHFTFWAIISGAAGRYMYTNAEYKSPPTIKNTLSSVNHYTVRKSLASTTISTPWNVPCRGNTLSGKPDRELPSFGAARAAQPRRSVTLFTILLEFESVAGAHNSLVRGFGNLSQFMIAAWLLNCVNW